MLVVRSTGESLVAVCVAGEASSSVFSFANFTIAWGFYVLAWFLERPFVWDAVEQGIAQRVKLPKEKMNTLLSGLHIRAVGAVHNTIQV